MNAKNEFIKFIGKLKIKCVQLSINKDWEHVDYFSLRCNHSIEEYETFLNDIDIDYDCGYGSQELEGIIWFTDNSWAERMEYDGSEWWTRRSLPNIPNSLQ